MTLRFTMRGGHDGGRPIRPSLWCRRGESYIFSDFLRRNAGTNSTAGTSFDFLAGFTAFIAIYEESEVANRWSERASTNYALIEALIFIFHVEL